MLSDTSTRTIAEYSDPTVNLCDGQWRALTFQKRGQQATVLLAGTQVKTVGDPGVAMVLALTSYLYIGGIKSGSEAAQFVQDNGLLVPGEGEISSSMSLFLILFFDNRKNAKRRILSHLVVSINAFNFV